MRKLRPWLPALVCAAVILSASNDAFSFENSETWLETIAGRDLPDSVNFLFRKAGHVVAYGLLGFLAWRADRRLVVALGFTLLIAAIDETRQAGAEDRTGSAADVLLDMSGATAAVLLARRSTRQP